LLTDDVELPSTPAAAVKLPKLAVSQNVRAQAHASLILLDLHGAR
jgi:hypothetical protein